MKLTFAGAGAAFTTDPGQYQSNMVLEHGDSSELLLIDCGSDARRSLRDLNIGPADIGTVYVSHLHSDHCGGLEWLALMSRYGVPGGHRPRLIMPEDVAARLWSDTLSGGLRSTSEGPATLETYFRPEAVSSGDVFHWAGHAFQTVRADHVGHGRDGMTTHGLFFTVGTTAVYISGDMKFQPESVNWAYEAADIIFHDGETGARTGVHAHYEDLKSLPSSVREKMWLYHTTDGPKPNAVEDGFRGIVATGQSFELGCR